MNWLPAFAMKNRAVVMAAAALLVLWGAIQWKNAPRREDPEIRMRTCAITVIWPGAPAVKIEQLVSDPIESAIDTLEEIKFVKARCTSGLAAIFVDLNDNVTDLDTAWSKIRAEVEAIELPQGCFPPNINTNFGDTSAMVLGIYQKPPSGTDTPGRNYTLRELDQFADRLKDELKQLPAVARVDRIGVRQEAIYLETTLQNWSQLGLTLDDLRNLISARNIVAPGGTVHTTRGSFNVRPTGELEDVGELSGVIVAAHEQTLPVALTDLGIVPRRTYADPPRQMVRTGDLNGTYPAVVLSFTMQKGNNVVELGEQVRKLLDRRSTFLPEDVEVVVLADQPANVDNLVKEFVGNLGQAVIIVAIVAWLMLGFRIAFVMAVAIPVVILAAFGLVRFFGVQLEQMSIAALIIALGMLVDNAIEVCDNTHRLLGLGYSRVRAAVLGASQVSFPVLIATLTTVFAFLPMLTLPGGTGEYIYSLPVVVATTLMLSWLVAMTLTAILAYWMLRPGHTVSPLTWIARGLFHGIMLPYRMVRKRAAGEGETTRSDPYDPNTQSIKVGLGIYQRMAHFTLRTQPAAIVVCVVLFILSLNLGVGTQFFPPTTRTQFAIDVNLPEGSPLSQTEAACDAIENKLRWLSSHRADGTDLPRQRLNNFVTYIGEGGPRFFLSLETMPPTPGYAQICVNTVAPTDVPELIEDIRKATADLAGVRVVPTRLMFGPPVKYPIAMRIYGSDLDRLRNAASELEDILRNAGGTWDVNNNWGNPGYELVVDTDEARAKYAGVVPARVAQSLNAYFNGHFITTFREGDHQIPVYLRLPPDQRHSLDPAWSATIEGLNGKVPIDQVADLRTEQVITRFERRELSRCIEVRCQVNAGLLSSKVLAGIEPQIEAFKQKLETSSPGYRLEVAGEKYETKRTSGNMAVAFGISFILIVGCLIVQYNGFAKVGIILFTLPLATTGAFFGLWVTGEPMSFMAQLGMLSLAGVVLNAAIVLIEFVEMLIKQHVDQGMELAPPGERSYGGLTRSAFRKCVVQGSALRITPIVLTTLTTVGGLVPLYLFGGDMWRPLAVVLIYGLLLAAVLTLLVLPAVYSLAVEVFRMKVFTLSREDQAELKAAEKEAAES
ncbi:MAG: efflux RND transporter permease subunit [Planctomycetota bacterium]